MDSNTIWISNSLTKNAFLSLGQLEQTDLLQSHHYRQYTKQRLLPTTIIMNRWSGLITSAILVTWLSVMRRSRITRVQFTMWTAFIWFCSGMAQTCLGVLVLHLTAAMFLCAQWTDEIQMPLWQRRQQTRLKRTWRCTDCTDIAVICCRMCAMVTCVRETLKHCMHILKHNQCEANFQIKLR